MKKKKEEITTTTPEETYSLGWSLAKEIKKDNSQNQRALVIGLMGELGSGKTTFVQGLARGLGIEERVTSPSFVLIKRYSFEYPDQKKSQLYHIDCYRFTKAKDLADLGFADFIDQSAGVVLVEWASRVKDVLPEDSWKIHFEYIDFSQRKIIIER